MIRRGYWILKRDPAIFGNVKLRLGFLLSSQFISIFNNEIHVGAYKFIIAMIGAVANLVALLTLGLLIQNT